LTGVIKRVLLPRGYGFIYGDDGREYFMQARECNVWSGETIREGLRVQFESKELADGRFRALRVVVL